MFKPNVLIYCFVVTVLIRRHRGLREVKHGYDSVICSAKGAFTNRSRGVKNIICVISFYTSCGSRERFVKSP